MPRPGPQRGLVGVKMSDEGERAIQELADAEAGGNKSEMIRRLLSEALAARAARAQRGTRPRKASGAK